MSADELAVFIAARYDEAESLAKAATPGPWAVEEDEGAGYVIEQAADEHLVAGTVICDGHPGQAQPDAVHIAACGPAHRLADIALKRAILELYTGTLAIVQDPPLERGPAAEAYARAYGRTVPLEGMISARDYMDAKRELAVLEPVVRHLGTEFSAHPDYREAWKP